MKPKQEIQALLGHLKSCSMRRDLQWGRTIHAKAVESRTISNMHVATGLIKMYANCGMMVDAHRVFDDLQKRDVVSWTALLLGYADNGDGQTALDLLSRMKAGGCLPNSVTYIGALKACTSLALDSDEDGKKHCLARGRQIHSEIGCDIDHYLQNTLIDMYCKCGSMVDARRVFDSIQEPGVVAWTALVLGYAENGNGHIALDLFSRMKAQGCVPDSVTYIAALKACMFLAADTPKADCLELGRKIHLEIGTSMNPYVQNTLIDMYAKFGSIVEAHGVFSSMQKPSVVSWNTLLLGYAENGEARSVLDLFLKMKALRGCAPTSVTYIAVLKACTSLASSIGKELCLERGRQIHSEIGSNLNHQIQNILIDMYAKCGSLVDAQRVFDGIQKPSVVSWTSLLLAYAGNGERQTVLELFTTMKKQGCLPDALTYVTVLKACASLAVNASVTGKALCLERGREIHLEIGSHMDQYLRNALIDMYAKCGSMVDARCVFDSIQNPDVISWNALLLGYAENGEGCAALSLFSRMKARDCSPDSVTYVAALKACTSLAVGECLERGREIHSQISCELNSFLQSSLIDMYAKCGSMVDARRVFDSFWKPNVVAWTALIMGYAENGDGHIALDLFTRMKACGCAPDSVTYIAALKACGFLGDLELGRKVHSEISDFTTSVVTSLVGFYAKCGSMPEAREVFDTHTRAREVSSWNSLLAGYARFGDNETVFNLFEAMQDFGSRPNAVTFVCLLLCCSHGGLVEKAREYLEAMPVQYGVTPIVMHYTCMVDALGRANQLNEAIEVMRGMPYKPHVVTWSALLGACRKWRNAAIGKLAFQSLVGMNNKNASVHVLMADICGVTGTWEDEQRVLLNALGHSKLLDVSEQIGKFVTESQQLRTTEQSCVAR